VRLVFRQGGEERPLAVVDAGPDLSFSERVRVPRGASPGPARVVATNVPSRPDEVAPLRVVDEGPVKREAGAATP
jgi:hypothetical protein